MENWRCRARAAVGILGLLMGLVAAKVNSVELVVEPPANYASTDTVHVVGNFNNWALEGDDALPLTHVGGKLRAELVANNEHLFFTFVKNKDWSLTPASETGKSLCTYHRKLDDSGPILAAIPAWKGDAPVRQAPSTISGNVRTIRHFTAPEEGRQPDVAVYLPPSYEVSRNARFPVLYMLDGQNVFDGATAYSDEWQVDETLEQLIANGVLRELIVVAVPNSENRWREYNPWNFVDQNGREQEGRGGQTMHFIVDRLKPYIDLHFRTRPGRADTGMAGSSLAGLMALYAALEHSDIFGFVAAFSPALDIKNSRGLNVLFEAVENKTTVADSKIYFDIGKVEYGDFQRIERLQDALLARGVNSDQLMVVKDDVGRHCELDWSRRLPHALKWWLVI